MGQTLSEPVTTKETSSAADARFWWAASGMQGWRISMEDAHAAILDLCPERYPNHAFFAVFDGHGGANVAKYCGAKLHHRICNDKDFAVHEYGEALRSSFLGMDVDIRSDPDMLQETSGCTAVGALVTDDNRIFVANVGDSRAVLCQAGAAVPLSEDHKPTNESELARIVAAGGFVEFGRVNGNLALSRAIGDFEFKQNKFLPPSQQIVTADPDIRVHGPIDSATDEFLVIACDGIWDVLSNQEVVTFVRRALAAGCGLEETAERLMERCLASDTDLGGVGCDNMTVVIVAILGGRTRDEWVRWVTRDVRPLEGVVPKSPALSMTLPADSAVEVVESSAREVVVVTEEPTKMPGASQG